MEYECSLHTRCRTEHLACSSYAQYVRTGKSADPRTRIQPVKIGKDGKSLVSGGPPTKMMTPAPTRKIYKLVEADHWGAFLDDPAATQKADDFAAEVVADMDARRGLEWSWGLSVEHAEMLLERAQRSEAGVLEPDEEVWEA